MDISKKIIIVSGIILLYLFTVSFQLYSEEVTIGYAGSFRPMTFQNDSGDPDGFVVELYSRIFEDLGYQAVFITGPFKDLYQKVLNLDIDVFATMTRTPERDDLFFWPEEPTHSGWGQLFVPEEQYIGNITELRGMRIGLMEGEAKGKSFITLMETMNISFEVVYFSTFEDVIQNVINSNVFAGVANNLIVASDNRISPTGVVFAPTATYTTTAEGNSRIKTIIEKANTRLNELRGTPGSYYWILYEKWLAPAIIEKNVISSWIKILIAVIAAGGILSLIVARLLKNQVVQRTAELRTSLNEKDILLKEVHHRVKNNMAIISSFLALQIVNSEDEKISGILKSSQRRIASMALVHELLYKTENLSHVYLKDYITRLVEGLLASFNFESDKINISIKVEDIIFDMHKLIPLGMIINEILSNSFKHGFTNFNTAAITINATLDEDRSITLIINDNGDGIPDEIIKNQGAGLGLSLIKGLANQIDSILDINCSAGTEYKLVFSE